MRRDSVASDSELRDIVIKVVSRVAHVGWYIPRPLKLKSYV